MRLALLPLDERPVNTRYPRLIAAIAGLDLRLPPPEALPRARQAADLDALHAWLSAQTDLDGLVLSLEMLTSGGLIASRISDAPLEALLEGLKPLLSLRERHADLMLLGFNVITRIPDADNAFEEPAYWARYGRRLHRYSQLSHRAAENPALTDELDALRAELPPAVRQDFTQRRLRNHLLNLRALDWAAQGIFDTLVISSDDTSAYGMGTQEKNWLQTWARRLELSDERLLMYPGADEVGCVLLMRAIWRHQARPAPRFYLHYAIDADRERIAPYEDSAVHVTVTRQIQALGGEVVAQLDEADFIVAVNPPSAIGQEYDAEHRHFAAERERRAPYLDAFVADIAAWVSAGRAVILGDVAYPNGSDPDLIAGLLAQVDVRRLAAYGAWNTAGNTLGTALAQGLAASLAISPAQQEAQQRFLLHRFLEDWGYQHRLRPEIRAWLQRVTGQAESDPAHEAETIQRIHAGLNDLMPRLGALAEGWRVASVRLPWQRTFEIDFELERL